MNYARLQEWIGGRVEDLVNMGVPRPEAEAVMMYVEASAIAAESRARSERQFLLEFDRLGSVELARRHGVTPQAVCRKRTRILQKLNPALNARLNVA